MIGSALGAGSTRHAICYVGESLDDFAERKAQAILCESGQAEPCNTCRSCIKVQNKSHPDLLWVREYKVKEVREVVATSAMRPNDGEFKVYIFTNADTMRAECQNALLKFTEEPPDYVRIIFTAASPDRFLDTIKSRFVFINADNAGDDTNVVPQELTDIVNDFITALKNNNELKAASALSRIKNRDELGRVLELISGKLHGAVPATQNYVEAQKFLLDCIDDLIFNPNIALTCTYVTAGMCEKLKITR